MSAQTFRSSNRLAPSCGFRDLIGQLGSRHCGGPVASPRVVRVAHCRAHTSHVAGILLINVVNRRRIAVGGTADQTGRMGGFEETLSGHRGLETGLFSSRHRMHELNPLMQAAKQALKGAWVENVSATVGDGGTL